MHWFSFVLAAADTEGAQRWLQFHSLFLLRQGISEVRRYVPRDSLCSASENSCAAMTNTATNAAPALSASSAPEKGPSSALPGVGLVSSKTDPTVSEPKPRAETAIGKDIRIALFSAVPKSAAAWQQLVDTLFSHTSSQPSWQADGGGAGSEASRVAALSAKMLTAPAINASQSSGAGHAAPMPKPTAEAPGSVPHSQNPSGANAAASTTAASVFPIARPGPGGGGGFRPLGGIGCFSLSEKSRAAAAGLAGTGGAAPSAAPAPRGAVPGFPPGSHPGPAGLSPAFPTAAQAVAQGAHAAKPAAGAMVAQGGVVVPTAVSPRAGFARPRGSGPQRSRARPTAPPEGRMQGARDSDLTRPAPPSPGSGIPVPCSARRVSCAGHCMACRPGQPPRPAGPARAPGA